MAVKHSITRKQRRAAARWIRNLRSGKFKQGRGTLRRDDRYCCLGVLAATDFPEKVATDPSISSEYGDSSMFTSLDGHEVLKLTGLKISTGLLVGMNDNQGISFEGIANVIEERMNAQHPDWKVGL